MLASSTQGGHVQSRLVVGLTQFTNGRSGDIMSYKIYATVVAFVFKAGRFALHWLTYIDVNPSRETFCYVIMAADSRKGCKISFLERAKPYVFLVTVH